MAKHIQSTGITVLKRAWTDIESKLIAGLGTSITATSIVEALRFLHITNYPTWVPTAIAIAAYFLGGFFKKSSIATTAPTDSPALAAAEVAASTVGADLAGGDVEGAIRDSFAAAGLVPAEDAPTPAPSVATPSA